MSALTGLTPDTLRYYEREGLLQKPARTSGGFRLYGTGEVERLIFIKRAQAIGLSLDEIRSLIAAAGPGARCRQMRDLIHARIGHIDGLLGDLRGLRKSLVEAERACDRALAVDPTSECPVVTSDVPGLRVHPRRRHARQGRDTD